MLLAVVCPARVCLSDFVCSGVQFCLLLGSCLCFVSFLYLGLYVLEDDALVSCCFFIQTKNLCVLIRIWAGSRFGAPLGRFKLSSEVFYWLFQGGASFVDHSCYICLVLLYFSVRLFIDTLWSLAGKGLTSWPSFAMSYCEVVIVSRARCGA